MIGEQPTYSPPGDWSETAALVTGIVINLFGVLPPLLHIASEIYNTNLPTLHEAFDVNPIAAMPSLHAALPTLCVLHAANLFGWLALVPAAYLLTVYVAIVYLGEHYFVDVVAGARKVQPPKP